MPTQTVCSIQECDRPLRARGFCALHYGRWDRHGDPLAGRRGRKGDCEICGRPAHGQGLCAAHHQRLLRTGDPTGTLRVSPLDRALSLIEVGVCWEWAGTLNGWGYGVYGGGGRKSLAHRYIYEALVGEIPDGLTLDHLCFNRRCVNPDHLEPCTAAENTRRAMRRLHGGIAA